MNRKSACYCCGLENYFEPAWPTTERCLGCGSLTFTGGNDVAPAELYNQDYFEGGEYKNYRAHQATHLLNFQRKFELLKSFSAHKPHTALDFGCAYGFFLDVLRERGVDRVAGIEASPPCLAACSERGIAVYDSLPKILDQSFDLVTLWDVFEHLEKPSLEIERLSAMQKRGGVLALTTVDVGALVPRLRKSRWRQFHPPTHLHYPTRRALKCLVEKHGYKVVYHKSFGYYRALEEYLPLARKLPRKLAVKPVYLNLYDTQFLAAIKG